MHQVMHQVMYTTVQHCGYLFTVLAHDEIKSCIKSRLYNTVVTCLRCLPMMRSMADWNSSSTARSWPFSPCRVRTCIWAYVRRCPCVCAHHSPRLERAPHTTHAAQAPQSGSVHTAALAYEYSRHRKGNRRACAGTRVQRASKHASKRTPRRKERERRIWASASGCRRFK